MKLKWGALVVDGRNKIGGHVASKNRAGSYMRTKVTPVNPRTTYQAACRNRLATNSSAFRALTASQILAWNAAVDQWMKTDIFGDLKKPSGFNLHQRLNNNILRGGGTAITSPPTPANLSRLGSAVLLCDNGPTFTITVTLSSLEANEVIECSATPALSPGISFVKSELRIIKSNGTLVAGVFTGTSDYVAKFGAMGAVGQKVFASIRILNTVTGQASVPRLTSTVIVST